MAHISIQLEMFFIGPWVASGALIPIGEYVCGTMYNSFLLITVENFKVWLV